MTREETIRIIRIICDSYPNYKPNNLSETVDVWQNVLSEYTYEQISIGLKSYILSDTSGFAPSIGQIVSHSNRFVKSEVEAPDEWTAWDMVERAIKDSLYHAEERFEKFPPIVQKAVGSPSNLRAWGQGDIEVLGTVVCSNFLKTYRTLLVREEQASLLPPTLKALMQNATTQIGMDVRQIMQKGEDNGKE